jgi:hypothetical protein
MQFVKLISDESPGRVRELPKRETWKFQKQWVQRFGAPYWLKNGHYPKRFNDHEIYELAEEMTKHGWIVSKKQFDSIFDLDLVRSFWVSDYDNSALINDIALDELVGLLTQSRYEGIVWDLESDWCVFVFPWRFEAKLVVIPEEYRSLQVVNP